MFFSQNFLGVLKSYQSFCHVAITVCRTSVFYFGILVVVVFLEYFYSSTIFFYPRSLCGQNITWILLGLFSDTTYFFGGKGISSLNVKMRAYKAMRVLARVVGGVAVLQVYSFFFFRFTLYVCCCYGHLIVISKTNLSWLKQNAHYL